MDALTVGDFVVDNHSNIGYIVMRVTPAKEPRDTTYRLHRITDDVVTTRFHYEILNPRHWSVARPIEA
jgi:hypothetical protein